MWARIGLRDAERLQNKLEEYDSVVIDQIFVLAEEGSIDSDDIQEALDEGFESATDGQVKAMRDDINSISVSDDLTKNQIEYAANDVIYLHEIKNKLDKIIKREGKTNLANACFKFLSTRVDFDLMGWQEKDIFQHK